MKIAIVRQKYTPFGGAERFVERALDGLRTQGVEVTMIAREWSGDPAGVLRCDPFYLGRTWRDRSFCHGVQNIIAEGRFDLVQSHERIPGCHIFRAGDGVHATWLELRGKARGGIAPLASALSPWHRYMLSAEASMYAHPNLRAVICNSRMVRDDIARRFGVPDDKLHVIHNGVDLDIFHPGLRDEHRARVRSALAIPADMPVILFVGSGFERKGLPTLLRALASMKTREACLVVVGKDRDQTLYERLAQTLDVDQRTRFLGGQQDVRPYYGAADMFCLPTLYDPMPNAALEALACGLPVVTSTSSGAAELIRTDCNGTVVDASDIQAVARDLDRLIRSDRPDPVVVAATVAGLGRDAMAARLAALYRQLAIARPL